MPIKFRCEHCRQLMGIARRKAGTQVQCPKCRRSVTVPRDEPGESPLPAGKSSPRAAATARPAAAEFAFPGLFEQSDIEEILKPEVLEPAAYAVPPPVPAAPQPQVDVEPVAPVHPEIVNLTPVGFLVTPLRLTILIVVGLLALAGAFASGIYVGRWVL